VVTIACIWSLGVARLAVACEDHERLSFEPALAALLSVAPPAVLLRRSVRERCFCDATDAEEEMRAAAAPRAETSSGGGATSGVHSL